MINYKQKAKNYHTAVSEYDVPTIEEMVTESYIQHNPKVPTGRAAFVSLIPQLASFGSKIKNIRMLNDGQYVIMHHQWDNATPFGFDTTAAFHIIRFNEQGFIAEHWNVMTALGAPNTSGRNLIDGETTIDDLDKTLQNKAKIRELGHLLCTQKNTVIGAELPRFFHAELQQHSPNFGDGLTALQTVIGSEEIFPSYHKQHAVFGEGNFVLSISEGTYKQSPTAIYDLFRLRNERIEEHWSIYKEIPSEGLANDNTMFNF